MRPPRGRGRKQSLFVRQNLFSGGSNSLRVRVRLTRGLAGPVLPLKIEATDPIFGAVPGASLCDAASPRRVAGV